MRTLHLSLYRLLSMLNPSGRYMHCFEPFRLLLELLTSLVGQVLNEEALFSGRDLCSPRPLPVLRCFDHCKPVMPL